MKTNTSDKIVAYLTLFSGLSISAVAVYYSVAGLVSIFAAAVIPIIVMGVALEVSKLVATVWVKLNWQRAPKLIKIYLCTAIAILMVITSMGIFGYLSKAHLDQAVPTGDVADKVALIDEKIKTQKENIDAARKALKQMDESVDQTMARSSDEKGADKAAALRRAQQRERNNLQNDISKAQSTIAGLNEERAPIAKELRKVEAEVGPIKYIAALLYGDNPDQNILEKSVRFVIIVIVMVFDPLAVILLLASQYSFQWFRQDEEGIVEVVEPPKYEPDDGPLTDDQVDQIKETVSANDHAYLDTDKSFWDKPEGWVSVPPQVYRPEELEVHPDEGIVTENEHDEEEDESDTEEVKQAKRDWKQDHPDSSLKLQRKLFEKGVIKKLPWEDYIKPVADFSDDEAAEEAAKWAQEQIEKNTNEEIKKKDSELDGESGQTTSDQDPREVGYQQNAEQNQSTLWNKLKQAKE